MTLMKSQDYTILIANSVFEFIVGIASVAYPEVFVQILNPTDRVLFRSLGVGCIAMSGLSILMLRFSKSQGLLQAGCFVLLYYHAGLAIVHAMSPMRVSAPMLIASAHGLFAIAFIAMIVGMRKRNRVS